MRPPARAPAAYRSDLSDLGRTHRVQALHRHGHRGKAEPLNLTPVDVIDRLNTEMRGWAEQTGGRARACCWVDPRYPDSAIAEISRASTDGGVPAVALLTAYQDTSSGELMFLDDPAFKPVLAAADQANVAIFVHASAKYAPTSQPRLPAPAESYLTGTLWMLVETTLCLTRLVLSGVFDRHPGLRMVFGQLGGVFPFALGRFDLVHAAFAKVTDDTRSAAPVLRRLRDYAGSIYVDTHSMDRPALECALEVLGPTRLVFGSDYPVTPEAAGRAGGLAIIRSLGLNETDLDAILAANATALLDP